MLMHFRMIRDFAGSVQAQCLTNADGVVRSAEMPAKDNDMINSPPHYTHSEFETWDVIEAWKLNYNIGCALKYLSRADYKGKRLEDLRKARAYLDREISLTEAGAR